MANRLALERSPYLVAHADDPVDWFPWGEEALEKARREDLPIFLSLGFSACHWCHVIHRESFLDPDIAGILNRSFVPVKVDRQERPDLDAVIMAFCIAMTGGGGWPLTAILTPGGLPFFAGTYFPPRATAWTPGLLDILSDVSNRWRIEIEKEDLVSFASKLAGKLAPPLSPNALERPVPPGEAMDLAFESFLKSEDTLCGGFGTAPKFPIPGNLLFLLHYERIRPGSGALAMAARQLEAMRLGGVFDHLGYGFSRYSVDRCWHIPHFEKMLPDNALLALLYNEVGSAVSRPALARVSGEVRKYLERDMRRPDGGYCASEDADSEGEEGLFYTWTREEVSRILHEDETERFCEAFGVSWDGNFENGRSVLRLENKKNGTGDPLDLGKPFEGSRALLLAERSGRVRPARDDSAIAEWNGLLLGALARLGREEPGSLEEARSLWRFCLERFSGQGGRLSRVAYASGPGIHNGCLDDYSAMLWGLSELYGSTGDRKIMERAELLYGQMEILFARPGLEGFDFLPSDGGPYPARIRHGEDGALPSGNGLAAYAAARLFRFSGDIAWKERACSVYRGFEPAIASFPGAFATLLAGMAEIQEVEAEGPA